MKNQKTNLVKVLVSMFLITMVACQEEGIDNVVEQSKKEGNTNKSNLQLANAPQENYELAKRWAPIHYADVDATGSYALGGKSDYITAINYDGDWNGFNNWNNAGNYSLAAHCYYSVVESETHWFITYAFFHPRDWTDNPLAYSLDQHENDLEGVLVVVEKNGTPFGTLRGAVTVNHSDFFSYIPSGSPYTNGLEDIDGTLEMREYNGVLHPVTAQECKGHGLKAWPQHNIDGDGIIYYPSANWEAQIPSNNSDNYVEYRLVDIFESGGLWDQRFNTQLFSSASGGFTGDDFKSGGANAPWAWNDGNDAMIQTGEWATDPAKLFENYFDGTGNYARTYTDNKYNPNAGGVATVYQHCNYNGYAVALPVGNYTLAQLKSYGINNDDLSSVKVANGYKITLYYDDNFGGSTVTISSGSNNCLGNFNDKASSVKVSMQ